MRRQAMTADPELMDDLEMLRAHIRAARDGDTRAFEELMLATERRVASIAWHILGDAEEVKEALQETFLRVFRHLGSYDEHRDFFGWLYRITVNVCRDLQARRRKWRFHEPIEAAADIAAQDDEKLGREDVALLIGAIDALAPKERLAIILRDIEEMTAEEAAEILDSSAATVRVQVRNARAKIRKWIEERR